MFYNENVILGLISFPSNSLEEKWDIKGVAMWMWPVMSM